MDQPPSNDALGTPDTGDAVSDAGAAVTDNMNSFSQPAEVNTTNQSFLDSNGIIAKIVFLVMVIVIFVMLFYVIVGIMNYVGQPSSNPMLINGQIVGNDQHIIAQSPGASGAMTLLRSNNQAAGIEFSWSVWLSIGTTGSSGSTAHELWHSPIFIKGDASIANTDGNQYASLNNGPGVYFGPPSDPNHLYILMDTVDKPAIESPELIIDVGNLPTDYFHLTVRCQNTYIDIYINGNLVKRQNLNNVPKQNYYDVNVCPFNGFNGLLSNLQYFNYALSVIEINTIVKAGPNTTNLSKTKYNPVSVNAISTYWYNSFIQ